MAADISVEVIKIVTEQETNKSAVNQPLLNGATAESQELSIDNMLASSAVNAGTVFKSESCLWLKAIHRRLAGRPASRITPKFTGAFHWRCLAVKATTHRLFKEPLCYLAQNKKGKVLCNNLISFERVYGFTIG